MSFQEMFKTEKPIIGLLHIRALPADPRYMPGCTMKKVVEHAMHDLKTLQEGGVDAVLFTNEYSMPYQCNVDHVTTAAMARVIGELIDQVTVPYGVHVICDGKATIDLAAAVEAKFVRSVFTGAYAGEGGLRSTDVATTLRRRNELGLHSLKMFYMLNAESDGDLSNRDYSVISKAIIFKCAPDGLCVSGIHAGHGVSQDMIKAVREASGNIPILCNTGCTYENIDEMLQYSDGAFVGTSFKKDGDFLNLVDVDRVKKFMKRVRSLR